MNTPGLFPIVGDRRSSLKQRLQHVLAGARTAPWIGRRWLLGALLSTLTAVAGIGFAQPQSPVPTTVLKTDAAQLTPVLVSKTDVSPVGVSPTIAPSVDRSTVKSLAVGAAVPPTGTPPMREAATKAAPKDRPPSSGAMKPIRGTVLAPDGKPAAVATVSLDTFHWRSGDWISWERVASTRPNDRGRFELVPPPGEEPPAGKCVFATADGLGFDYQLRSLQDPAKPLVLKLVPDQPIRGRVLDLEGRPIAGARVHVVSVTDSLNRSLDPWLNAMKSGVERYNSAAHALLGEFIKTIPGERGATTTDRDGRFILRGLGAERVVDLAIESDATAYRRVTVATRNMTPIVRATAPGVGGLEIVGAEFTTGVKPTRPVLGTVRDAKTGHPLSGVEIESWHLAGDLFAGQRVVRATSDARGHYCLVGLPKGVGNAILVLPNDDQPYFMRRFDVPDTPGIEPVTVDVELVRGLWITGRVTDKETGKPVGGQVNYWPFLDNPFAKDRPGFGPGHEMVTDQYRWPIRADGSFRIPGLPGRGVVGAEADFGYRQGAGAAEIHDADRQGRLRTYRDQRGPSLKYPATMKEIKPTEGAESLVCDLVCDHGETVKVTVLDPDGKPARHVSLSKLTKDGKLNDVDSPFELNGLSLNVATSLLVEQKDRGLATLMTLKLAEDSPRTLTVKLEPSATVTGRLLDEDGVPIKGVTVHPQIRGRTLHWEIPPAACNENGGFEFKGLPAGETFSFMVQGTATPYLQGFGSVAVEAGKTTDLGDIRITRRGVPKVDFIRLQKPPAKPHAASEIKPKPTVVSSKPKMDAPKVDDGPWLIRGTVLRPDGQPAAGAEVLLLRRFWSNQGRWTARAEAKGEFEIRIPRPPYDGLGDGSLWLAAQADGFGVAWLHGRAVLEAMASNSLVLRLVPESPIHGRVVDLEGRPVSGVRVHSQEQAGPADGPDLGPWLEAAKRGLARADTNLGPRFPGYDDEASPPIVSDRDGRFVVRGIGPQRVVQLQVSGATIASEQFRVVTHDLRPIAEGGGPYRRTQIFGNDFTYQAGPTRPIVGTVRDAVTGRPLAGVRVELRRDDFINTQTDAEGKFRLVGVPKAMTPDRVRNRLVVAPDLDVPYFASEVDIPETPGLEPVTIDIKLKRGLWITGRVTDKATGKPVRAQVQYFPYASNPFVDKDEWRKLETLKKGGPQGATRADGTYRLPGFPGRAIVGVTTFTGGYRRGAGASEIPGIDKNGFFPTLGNPMPATARRQNALKEINLPPGAESAACDLALDSSGKVRLTVVDVAGKVVEDSYFAYSGIPAGSTMLGWPGDATFDIEGLAPKETRTFLIAQTRRKIARLFTLADDDKPASEMTITLEPCAIVRGRLLDEDGTPVKNVGVRASAVRNGRAVLELHPLATETDADGRFECDLPVGGKNYTIDAYRAKGGFLTVAKHVPFSAEKTIDLGEIKLQPRGTPKTVGVEPQKPAPAAKKLAANDAKPKRAAASQATSGSATKNDGPWLIRGAVVRPDGQPAAGAEILALRRYWSSRVSWRPMATARAGAKGEFEICVTRPGYDGLGSGLMALAARVDGFGIEWARGPSFTYGKEPSSPIVLRLVPESPIHGRVVDLEGRPMSGVCVRVLEQFAPKEGQDLGPWLDAVKKGNRRAGPGGGQLPGYEDRTTAPIVSDADGRFVVHGVGPERMVRLQVSGETIASEQFEVVTRSMTPLGAGPSYDPTQVFGKDFTYQAAPTQPIVGTVRDAVTGKPIAGVRVELSRRHDFIGTWSDAEGRFRLVGMPKQTVPADPALSRNRLVAAPSPEQPYFGNEVDIPQTAGLDPVTVDIKLRRGLWITGRVTDKVTGQPVRGIVHYFPYGSNPFVKPDEWRTIELVKDESHRVTRPDGTYRIVGLPWRAIVGVRATSGEYLKGVGASEIPGMDKNDRFPKTLGPASAYYENALKEINPPPGTESAACDLVVDPGGTVRIAFVDGAGKPVEDGYLLKLEPGVARSWGRHDSTYELAGLAPKESRTYQITQWQQKIAKVFTFEYDEKASQTLTVKLEPCATVRGRLVDEEGSPLKNVEVFAEAKRNSHPWFSLYTSGPSTDADGRFAIENLAAGCDSYTIRALAPKLDFVTVAEKVSFAPGKTIDLGEVKLQKSR